MTIQCPSPRPPQAAALRLAALFVAAGLCVWPGSASAQPTDASGVLAGRVTAEHGTVTAFRVKASDTVHRVSYTVFTVDGRYQIFNLPPSTYDVRVVEPGHESEVLTVRVAAGITTTADVAITTTGNVVRGAGTRSTAANRSYGGRETSGIDGAALVDFDTLYPPAPARDVMLRACFGCHGPAGFHTRGPKNEAGWRRAVERMFDPNGRVAQMAPGVPQVSHDTVTPDEKEAVIQYLTANFGPGSDARDLALDPLVRDEAALSTAVYIQYELNRLSGRLLANGQPPAGGIHSVFASQQQPGVIWVSGNHSNSIIRVDTRELDFEARTTEYWIANPENIDVTPHGIIEDRGRVYWVELTGDHLGELDPATGDMHRYPLPTKGAGAHSMWADSRGNLWYTYFAEANKIGRFDTRTKEITEYDTPEGWTGYGVVVDRQDRVWASGLSSHEVLMYNQETGRLHSYPMATPTRRPTVDSRGKVWAAHYYGNAISMIDPVTGDVTHYELPLKDGNPYDVWTDAEDNVWIENAIYNALVKFDQTTEVFTYFPFPELDAHTPKLDRDREGTLWFVLKDQTGGRGVAALKPQGNVPR